MVNKTKKYLMAMVVILIILAGGYFVYRSMNQKGSNQNFRLGKVQRGEISFAVTATGTINPVITVLVGSQISGTIKALYADYNSRVKQGQVIAQIDPAIFEALVEQGRANVLNAQANRLSAQSNLENARANLAKAEVAVADTKRTLDRHRPLLERNVISQATLDTAQANYDTALAQRDVVTAQVESAKSQVESSKAQVAQAKASLKVAETNLRYATIRSPVNGIVISRNVDVGQTVAASLQAPTLFTIAKDLTEMQVNTNVSEADVGRIAVNQEAFFTVDAFPENTFRGKVSEVRNAPITIQNVVTYDVIIKVDNKDLKLKPGMTANVSILIEHKEEVLKISNAALRFRPSVAKVKETGGTVKGDPPQKQKSSLPGTAPQGEKEKTGRVWVLSQKGQPTPVSIILGITDGTFSEVVAGDLQEGMEVIIEETSGKKQGQSGSAAPSMRGIR